jgi:gamma-glutamyl:cysteine ligase YbdK (ATP-grasp superfamily)
MEQTSTLEQAVSSPQQPPVYRLFECFGVEMEYMIVDRASLDVRPVADEVLRIAAGNEPKEYTGEVEREHMGWSNELTAHVLEFKAGRPARTLEELIARFSREVAAANEVAGRMGARLMPAAMHPWMDPSREMHLWLHDGREFYETFDRIFDCRGHGWSNLQSTHLNLPFAGDDEFARLHTAIRLLMPMLPALAASSPFMEGRPTGLLDNRLDVYRSNCRRVPEVTGQVIPEAVSSQQEYHDCILKPMYRAIAPLDPEGILQHEWLNARGAIARFERNAVEIRVLDVQEYPGADLAILAAVVHVLRGLTEERWSSLAAQKSVSTERLAAHFLAAVQDADEAVIADPEYLQLFGVKADSATAGDVWRRLLDGTLGRGCALQRWSPHLVLLLTKGPLARRMLRAYEPAKSRDSLRRIARRLADCLAQGVPF